MEVWETLFIRTEFQPQQKTLKKNIMGILTNNLQKCSRSYKEWKPPSEKDHQFTAILLMRSMKIGGKNPHIFQSRYCAHSDLNFKSPTKIEKIYLLILIQTFVKNIFNIRMLAGAHFLLSIFKPQVFVKAFFKLDKKWSQAASEMNKREDLRLLWTHSSGTCSMKHHRNSSPKAET